METLRMFLQLPKPALAVAAVGLILIIAGFVAVWFCFRVAASSERPKYWRSFFAGALVLGVLLAPASWLGTYWLGYPLESPDTGPGRAVGIPFMVAWFDSEGRDYVPSTMMPAVCANGMFWLLVPSLALATYGCRYRRLHAHEKT